MISICIPVYNTDCTKLVLELIRQRKESNSDIEVQLLDDASNEAVNFSEINNIPNVFFHRNDVNKGRSASRNILATLATKKFLLYLDGDSEICNPFFVQNWIQAISTNNDVYYGGSTYQKSIPSKERYLRWKVSTIRESRSFEDRKKSRTGFKTNNFLIKREIIQEIGFDERINGYGHEDTFFGYQLYKLKRIQVTHIDNPILNPSLDENEVFLQKTKEGILNLTKIIEFPEGGIEFGQTVRVYRFYTKLKKWNLLFILNLMSFFLFKGIFNHLKKGNHFALVPLFDLYKLFVLNQIYFKN